MPAVQVSYVERHTEEGRAGQIASSWPSATGSYVVEPGNEVEFGRGVAQGTADQECQPYNAATDSFIGVSQKSTTQNNENDKYIAGSHASVMSRGDIWVEMATNQGCTRGSKVRVSHDSGEEGRFAAPNADGNSSAADSDSTEVPGAYFMRTVSAPGASLNAHAVVRLATGDMFS